MPFIRTIQQYDFDVDSRQAGIDFANSGYGFAHANRYGRENLRRGIAPPDSDHPKFTDHGDDIDYQIEADSPHLCRTLLSNSAKSLDVS